jgi:type IV pilus assembly protein PilM
MGSMKNNTYFYHDKPIFGLDIGFSSLKVMQIDTTGKHHRVTGYGTGSFDPAFIRDGVIENPEGLAKAAYELFSKNIIGNIGTRRIALTIPTSHSYARTVTLPKLSSKKELAEAVRLETEQYIPLPIDDLYMDFSIISQNDKQTELLVMATPKKIIDSHMDLAALLGLDVVAIETTISAAARMFVHAERSDVPTILIDFGSVSSDITIYDKTLVVTGTAPSGGDSFTGLIADTLGVNKQEATVIKTKYGLGVSKKQKEILAGLNPILEQLLKEIRRMVRYYEERSGSKNKISQVVTMGGGANMPGLSEHMTNLLRLPVRMIDPWQHLDFAHLQPPNSIEKSMYVTVGGLALLKPEEIFK